MKYIINNSNVVQIVRAIERTPMGYVVFIEEPRRTPDQSDKFHAMIRDISKQVRVWAGLELSYDDWKRLLIDAFDRARGMEGRAVPSLDRKGVVILGSQSRSFSKKTAMDFCDFLYAWGNEHGVEFRDDL